MDLISIIVPVYNVEQYLNRCVESIVNQTYSNIEIILVDDGSPDHCPEICDKWAAMDSRIKVIHKENGGLSDARNIGLEIAVGDFIGFVDSDDWIAQDMYYVLYNDLMTNNSDISACAVKRVYESSMQMENLTKNGCMVLETEEAMKALIEQTWLKQPVWYKLYRREIIEDIEFPIGKYHEDAFWTYQIIGRAHRVSITDKTYYYYWQRGNSIMGKPFSMKRLDGLEAEIFQLDYINSNFPRLLPCIKSAIWHKYMYYTQMALMYLSGEDKEMALIKIASLKDKSMITLNDLKDEPFKQKVWFFLSKISLLQIARLRNLLQIGL